MEKAAIDLNRALELDSNLADAWAHRGIIRAERQDYPQAIADFDQALKLNPRLATTWANRGLALLMQGRIEEAEQNFARCKELSGRINSAAEELLQEKKGGKASGKKKP
jgi:tetratricopeptide (TPR) repeat protein